MNAKTKEMMKKIDPILEKYYLTQEEKELINKAKNQVRQSVFFATIGGSFGGMILGLRRKPINFLRVGLLTTGFAFIGSQVGFLMGYSSALKTVKSMPDQQKLQNIFKEVIDVFQNEREKRGLPIMQPPDYKRRMDTQEPKINPNHVLGNTQQTNDAWGKLRNKSQSSSTEDQYNFENKENQINLDGEYRNNNSGVRRNKYGDIIEMDDQAAQEMRKD